MDDGYLYNSSSFQLYDKNLGEARFYPKPRSTTDFNVRLSDSFGKELFTKIIIPGADYLKGYGKNVVFIGSILQLTPLKDSYSDLNSLPDSLSVYIADRQNRITSQLSGTTGYIYANKIVPAAFDKLPYYEVDITSFFTTEIATGLSDNSLLIGSVASKAGTTINPIVFARTGLGKEIVKMHVYCYLDKSK